MLSFARMSTIAAVAVLAVAVVATPVAVAKGRPLAADLFGANEFPGPGDADGAGIARLRLNQGQGRICYTIEVRNIALPASLAHIHVGAAGVAGPPVVTLVAPGANGSSEACATGVAKPLIKAIRKDPAEYYVNVHNSQFPNGAVRGQLEKRSPAK